MKTKLGIFIIFYFIGRLLSVQAYDANGMTDIKAMQLESDYSERMEARHARQH